MLLGFLFAVKAWSYGLDRYLLLYGDNGVVVGASYTDVHVQLPVLWLLIGLFDRRGMRRVGESVGAYLRGSLPAALSLFVGGRLPAVRRDPDAVSAVLRETERTGTGAALHRAQHSSDQEAYNLDKIAAKPFPAEQDLTFETLEANKATIDNIRLWDGLPLAGPTPSCRRYALTTN